MILTVVADTTKVRIFKQITTVVTQLFLCCMLLLIPQRYEFSSKSQQANSRSEAGAGCCWYHKGTNFQANHNSSPTCWPLKSVVADTTKVRIFKQITTQACQVLQASQLLLIPQRYEFSSKSQPTSERVELFTSCCWYHKGTNFQANHNTMQEKDFTKSVVADTTKVRIFKQITTDYLQ